MKVTNLCLSIWKHFCFRAKKKKKKYYSGKWVHFLLETMKGTGVWSFLSGRKRISKSSLDWRKRSHPLLWQADTPSLLFWLPSLLWDKSGYACVHHSGWLSWRWRRRQQCLSSVTGLMSKQCWRGNQARSCNFMNSPLLLRKRHLLLRTPSWWWNQQVDFPGWNAIV